MKVIWHRAGLTFNKSSGRLSDFSGGTRLRRIRGSLESIAPLVISLQAE